MPYKDLFDFREWGGEVETVPDDGGKIRLQMFQRVRQNMHFWTLLSIEEAKDVIAKLQTAIDICELEKKA